MGLFLPLIVISWLKMPLRGELSSPENIQALSFYTPKHLRLWLAEVSCIANMIYLLRTV